MIVHKRQTHVFAKQKNQNNLTDALFRRIVFRPALTRCLKINVI